MRSSIKSNLKSSNSIFLLISKSQKDSGKLNLEKAEKERRRQEAILSIKKKFGKNAILKGINYADGATQKERNQQIGGHHE